MKFIVSSSALLKQLSSLISVIVSNPVIPILENFLFEIRDKTLTITSSDLQTFLRTTLEVEAQGESRLAIPAKILIETLKNLANQPITFTIDEESYNIEITSNNGRYKLAGENANDFPEIPEIEERSTLDLSLDTFKNAINKTIFASTTDELKPSMVGLYLCAREDQVVFVATDGHRLSRYIKHNINPSMPVSAIIPKKPLSTLSNLQSSSENSLVNIIVGDSHTSFELDNIKIITRLVDERFPEYQNVLPNESPYKLTSNRDELLSSLKRVAIYSNKSDHKVTFKMAGSELQIITEDLDFSNEAVERLTCNYEGDDLEIAFNAKLLIEALNKISSEELVFHLGTPQRAILIFPKDSGSPEGIEKENMVDGENSGKEELLILIMPVALPDQVYV